MQRTRIILSAVVLLGLACVTPRSNRAPVAEAQVAPLAPFRSPLAAHFHPYPTFLQRQVIAVYEAGSGPKAARRANTGKTWAKDCLHDIRSEEIAVMGGGIRKRSLLPFKPACTYYHMIFTGLYYKFHVLGYQKGLQAMLVDAEAVIAMDPGYEEGGVYRVLGNIYLHAPSFSLSGDVTRDLGKASAAARKALYYGADNPENQLLMGEVLWEERDYEAARRYFETSLQSLPRSGVSKVREQALIDEIKAYLTRYERMMVN